MPSLLPILPFVIGSTLVGLLHVGCPTLQAQNNTLEQCAQTLQQSRQAIVKSQLPNQRTPLILSPSSAQSARQVYQDWAECVKGQKAPLSSFKTLTGESYDTAALAGKIVVINFWFMGCAPCRAEMPALNKLVNEYKGKGVLFLGFSTDRADRLKPAFFEQNRFDFQIVPESQNLARVFSVMGYPTTYIVDGQGIIRQAWLGVDENGIDRLDPYYRAKAAIDYLLTSANT